MDVPCRYFGLTRPRFSSDTSFAILDARGRPALLGVTDMIGRPIRLAWRNYMKAAVGLIQREFLSAAPDSLEDRAAFFRAQLLRHSRLIREIARKHDRSAFGFCFAGAAVSGTRCRIHWLGDCRAYLLRRPPGDPPAWECAALTRDHNALDLLVREKGELTLFRNEMQEMSRNLGGFLGMEEEPARAELESQEVRADLGPDDCLLLVSDGVHGPLLRVWLDRTRDRLDLPGLYLGGLLGEWLGRRPETDDPRVEWEPMIRDLVRDVELYTRANPACRDDIAAAGYHPDPPR